MTVTRMSAAFFGLLILLNVAMCSAAHAETIETDHGNGWIETSYVGESVQCEPTSNYDSEWEKFAEAVEMPYLLMELPLIDPVTGVLYAARGYADGNNIETATEFVIAGISPDNSEICLISRGEKVSTDEPTLDPTSAEQQCFTTLDYANETDFLQREFPGATDGYWADRVSDDGIWVLEATRDDGAILRFEVEVSPELDFPFPESKVCLVAQGISL